MSCLYSQQPGTGARTGKAELGGAPIATTAMTHSEDQTRSDPTNLLPHFLFYGSDYLQATPLSQAHTYQISSQPEIIYDLAFREEKQFSQSV